MSVILTILIVLIVISLITGLVKPELVKQPTRKKVGAIYGGILFVLLLISATVNSSEPNADTAPAPVATEASAPQSDQQSLEKNITDIANDGKFTYRSLEIDDGDTGMPAGSKTMNVGVNVRDFVSRNSLIRTTGELAANIFKTSFPSYLSPEGVYVYFYGDTTDRYGAKENRVIMVYYLDRQTYAKISWDNIDENALCDFLKTEETIRGGASENGPACNILVNIQ